MRLSATRYVTRQRRGLAAGPNRVPSDLRKAATYPGGVRVRRSVSSSSSASPVGRWGLFFCRNAHTLPTDDLESAALADACALRPQRMAST